MALAAAFTLSTDSSKGYIGSSGFPVASSMEPPANPIFAASIIVSAQMSGSSPYPFSRSADTGNAHALIIAEALSRVCPRVMDA